MARRRMPLAYAGDELAALWTAVDAMAALAGAVDSALSLVYGARTVSGNSG
jgi:hypothetical protein